MATIADLQKRIEELEQENQDLRAQLAGRGGGAAGWLVSTPHPSFSGQTMNIQFRRGMAFIPDGAGNEAIARQMASEFGYKVEHVADFHQLPEDSPVRRSMIDMLMIPERR